MPHALQNGAASAHGERPAAAWQRGGRCAGWPRRPERRRGAQVWPDAPRRLHASAGGGRGRASQTLGAPASLTCRRRTGPSRPQPAHPSPARPCPAAPSADRGTRLQGGSASRGSQTSLAPSARTRRERWCRSDPRRTFSRRRPPARRWPRAPAAAALRASRTCSAPLARPAAAAPPTRGRAAKTARALGRAFHPPRTHAWPHPPDGS